jgi:predicted DNA-binding transcriptional regulator AlpA
MAKEFYTSEEVLELTGVRYSTIWRWMADGKFPLARRIGRTSVLRWVRSDIETWIKGLCKHTGVKGRQPKLGRPSKMKAARAQARASI